ncbi:MAG: HAD family hydrolase [Desulfobacteraceae bacterium]|nr:MAG: HAD family hydrolase [Desulfobacteraceae bacterium]
MTLFFDIDGTLLDEDAAEHKAAMAFQKEHAELFLQPPDVFADAWRRLTEFHVQRFLKGEISFREQRIARMQALFAGVGRKLAEEEAGTLFKAYLKHYEANWCLFGDVQDCLQALKGRSLGIISNGDSRQQRQKLDQLHIRELFDPVIISSDLDISKPDAGIFLEACRQAGQSPRECIYVGDNYEVDILGSRNAGLRGIWLNRFGENRNEEADLTVIRSLAELPNVI